MQDDIDAATLASVARLRASLARGELDQIDASTLDPRSSILGKASVLVRLVLADWDHIQNLAKAQPHDPLIALRRYALADDIRQLALRLPT